MGASLAMAAALCASDAGAQSFYLGGEGGWTGGFRVYEYEMTVDVDGVGEYTSIIGSDAGS